MTLACEDAYSKLVDVVTVADDDRAQQLSKNSQSVRVALLTQGRELARADFSTTFQPDTSPPKGVGMCQEHFGRLFVSL